MDVKVPIGSVVHLYSLSWSYPSIIISSFVPSSCQARSNPISCGNIPSLTSHMQLRFLYYFLNPFLSSVFPKLLLAAGAESFIPTSADQQCKPRASGSEGSQKAESLGCETSALHHCSIEEQVTSSLLRWSQTRLRNQTDFHFFATRKEKPL